MRCPTCTKGSIIEINMRVSGSDLTFRRCGHCEAQTWESAEGVVPLTRVLELDPGRGCEPFRESHRVRPGTDGFARDRGDVDEHAHPKESRRTEASG